jgi:hypothetical protein
MGPKRFCVTRENILHKDYKFKKKFSAIYPEFKDITQPEISKIIKTFNKLCVINEMCTTREGVELPQKLGMFHIFTFRVSPDYKIVDFAQTNKLKKTVYFHNFETDSKMGKLMFRNNVSAHSIESNKVWGFVPGRLFKRSIAKAIKSNYKLFE